jgi:hypothetical protein
MKSKKYSSGRVKTGREEMVQELLWDRPGEAVTFGLYMFQIQSRKVCL